MARVTIYLIRHLRTIDNLEGRYSDASDPSLSDPPELTPIPQAILASKVICSPLRRAQETAERWLPNQPMVIDDNLKELNFGRFAGKTANEMKEDQAYRDWVDQGCVTDIPDGESFDSFKSRVKDAFLRHLEDGAVFVTHAGPIMVILEAFADTPYFSEHIGNGQIVALHWSTTLKHVVSYEVIR